jgi:hypothetical protein
MPVKRANTPVNGKEQDKDRPCLKWLCMMYADNRNAGLLLYFALGWQKNAKLHRKGQGWSLDRGLACRYSFWYRDEPEAVQHGQEAASDARGRVSRGRRLSGQAQPVHAVHRPAGALPAARVCHQVGGAQGAGGFPAGGPAGGSGSYSGRPGRAYRAHRWSLPREQRREQSNTVYPFHPFHSFCTWTRIWRARTERGKGKGKAGDERRGG